MKKKLIKPEKSQLRHAILDLLKNESVETQRDICQALKKQGFSINQATVSRILNKLGAIKVTEKNQTVYRLSNELALITPKYSLNQLILSISNNETLVVIQTTPGSAQLVARLLDQEKSIGILGTVAGDDTIFIAPEPSTHMQTLRQKIIKILSE